MENLSRDKLNKMLHKLAEIDYVQPADVPNIDLYMDQVLTFMDQKLGIVKESADDKAMTKTMINNYTKNQILPPPEKKKYSRDHILNLIFIYYMKNFMSMKEIKAVLDPVNDKAFGSDTELNFYDIYSEIVELEHIASRDLVRDVSRKYNLSRKSFTDADEADQKDLQDFSFFCLLAFDVFVKKMLIEQFISETSPQDEAHGEE